MGPWKNFRSLVLCHRYKPDDGSLDIQDSIETEVQSEPDSFRGKIVTNFPDEYHILKMSSQNEASFPSRLSIFCNLQLFFYNFIPRELQQHVPQICAALTPDRPYPRFFPCSCLASIESRGHFDSIDYTRRNGGLPETGKTLIMMRDVKADMAAPCWADFDLGLDTLNCLRMSGMTISSSRLPVQSMKADLIKMSLPEIRDELENFLFGHHDLIDVLVGELEKIFLAMVRVRGISFRGTSILIAYDADALPTSRFRVQVKLLSFTNVKLANEPCIYTLNGLVTLIEMLRSIKNDEYDLL